MIGRHILHYEILDTLGEGGMGVVYLAEDTRLHRKVALKFLPRELSASAEGRERLKSEARLAASLNHPNVATIYAIEEVGDELFLAMEYLPGLDLKAIQEHAEWKSISFERKIDFARQITSGLAAAHKRGIVHGDVKSGNIVIAAEQTAKILDFGLAHARGVPSVGEVEGTHGTIAYMSPEQLRGKEPDARSDIWSLGVVLYELMTGTSPFARTYEQAVVYSILHEKPRALRSIVPEIPEAIESAVFRALEKDPANRFQSTQEVLDRLDAWRADQDQLRTVDDRKHGPRTPIWITLGAIGLVLLIGALLLSKALLRNGSEATGAALPPAIAILPLQNLDPSVNDDPIGEGITEAVMTDLAKLPGLTVISRRSVRQFADRQRPVQDIGKALNVRYFLDGSVQRAGARIRVRCSADRCRVRGGALGGTIRPDGGECLRAPGRDCQPHRVHAVAGNGTRVEAGAFSSEGEPGGVPRIRAWP